MRRLYVSIYYLVPHQIILLEFGGITSEDDYASTLQAYNSTPGLFNPYISYVLHAQDAVSLAHLFLPD